MSGLPVSLDDVLNSIPAGLAPMLSESPELLGGGDCEDGYDVNDGEDLRAEEDGAL